MTGDGFTSVIHCERTHPLDVEPDARPVFCDPDNIMEVLDATGHLTLTWNPNDETDVKRAKDEFDRLKAAGFSFFATIGETGQKPVRKLGDAGTLTVERIEDFKPKRQRTVAVRPMQGG
jgi:hypothetical protein